MCVALLALVRYFAPFPEKVNSSLIRALKGILRRWTSVQLQAPFVDDKKV